MKPSIAILLAGLLLASGASAVAAQSAESQAVQSRVIAEQDFTAGLVVAIDPARGSITVKEAGSERSMTFHITRDADLRKDEAAIRLEAIQVGDPVAIEFRESGRGPVVTSVKVITPPRED